MLVNLSDVLTSADKTESIQADMELTAFTDGYNTYPVVSKEPLQLTLTNAGKGKAYVKGQVSLALMLSCDRCLQEVAYTFDLAFFHEVAAPNGEEELSEDVERQSFMEGYQLNVEDLINSEILINWPMKVLCKEDCKGICGQCGKNLNMGECGCDTFVLDPRMAVIKDIYNANNKEV